MSGMLSNTAERNPRPSVVGQEATGRLSTGIIEAQTTSESRKSVPLKVSGSTSQSWRRTGTVSSERHPHRRADEGEVIGGGREAHVETTLVTMAKTSIVPTMKMRFQSTWVWAWASFRMGEYWCCHMEAGIPAITSAPAEAT